MRIKHLSYASGGGSGLLSHTIGDLLRTAAHKWPKNQAMISYHENVKWSYLELLQRSEAIAQGLLSLGLPKHARVGIYSANCKEWLLTQMAASLADLILVNINPAYQVVELEHALNKVEVSALVMTPGFKQSNYIELLSKIDPELKTQTSSHLNLTKLPSLKHVILIGEHKEKNMMNFDDLYHRSSSDYEERTKKVKFEEATNIQFTSGTTGAPKAATLSHFNIVNNGYYIGETLKYTHHDRVAIPVPLYHCFGMVLGNLACISHGSTMIYPDFGFNPIATIEVIEGEKATSLYGVPTMFVAYVREQLKLKKNLKSLRTGIVAGAICVPELMKQIVDVLGIHQMTNAYGMTETSPVSFQLKTDADFEKRICTVGEIHPHAEAKIVDDLGGVVERGEIGEICTRGYLVMKGYWGDEKATEKSITKDGWMLTGDQGVMDEKGFLRIVGRSKDMIIRGGENIYPSEIEAFLSTHPSIEEIHVFGIPDEYFGEQVAAWIKLKSGINPLNQNDIENYCKGNIAHFKIPKIVKIVENFPITVTGKIQKYKMRAEYSNPKEI
jgi:fatty-acyl-CoA synthase